MSHFLKLLSQKVKFFQHVITTYNFHISHHYILTKRLKMSHLWKILYQKVKIFKHVIMTYISQISHHYISKEMSYIVPFQTDSIVLKVT